MLVVYKGVDGGCLHATQFARSRSARSGLVWAATRSCAVTVAPPSEIL